MFIKYPYLLGVGRYVDVDVAEKFICLLYGIEENGVKGIDNARRSLFVKAKRDLEMLLPIHNAELELHIKLSS